MTDQRAIANELLRRSMARETLDDYANYMSSSQHLDFIHPPVAHQRLITGAIDELLLPLDHPRHPKDEHGVPVTRLLITAPPGSAKSTYCSVQAPTYILARNPTWHILCSSNVGTLAESFNRRRRSACMTEEWQQVSGTSLNPDAQSVARFYTLEQGSIMAAGVNATIVGIRSNINILDDPIESWEQSQSENQLQKIWDWYEGEYRNRLVPTGLEIVMHQRWSRNDPAGVLLRLIRSGEETGWRVINLPLVAPEAVEEPDPLGRQPGEVLWRDWYTSKQLKEWQRDPSKWAALYQQSPTDEDGAWVGPEYIQYIQPEEWGRLRQKNEYRYMAAGDLALSINKGDWTVLVIVAITPNRDLIICDMVRKQIASDDSVDKLFELHEKYSPTEWLFDNDNATKVWERLVFEKARNDKISPPVLDLMPTRGKDKEIRAAAIRGYFRAKRVFIVNDAKWASDLEKEILSFPGSPDDQIDALGLVGRKFVQISGNDFVGDRKQEAPLDIIVEKEGQLYLPVGLDTLFEENERGRKGWNTLRIG